MRVKLLGMSGYNYEKNGVIKNGINLYAQSLVSKTEDDGRGNFKYGLMVDSIYLPKTFPKPYEHFIEYLGREVELIYTKELGDRYERLSDIVLCE